MPCPDRSLPGDRLGLLSDGVGSSLSADRDVGAATGYGGAAHDDCRADYHRR